MAWFFKVKYKLVKPDTNIETKKQKPQLHSVSNVSQVFSVTLSHEVYYEKRALFCAMMYIIKEEVNNGKF
ncbi:MAG: hypothetical protein D6710_06150 [Nitrospirae bacterium]|nr:MAG: hypothetical protein D6710_06150 [Nitrospirota bacterium]